jgi:hypothetical protein
MSDIRNELVIGEDNWNEHFSPVVDGHQAMKGLVPRDYSANPQGCYASAPAWSLDDMPLIPMEEWPERIKELESTKTRISDIYAVGNYGDRIPSLDQNGQGFCWAYSTTCAVQALRCLANMPYVPLSAHSVACKIYNFVDRGAWGALSLDFIAKKGVVPQSLWPAKSMNRQYDNDANWLSAMDYRVTEGWVDLVPAAYDRDMSKSQVATALLLRIPVVSDYNHWGHSVCAFDLVDVYPNRSATDYSRYGVRIKNSWTDRWGTFGEGVLKDSKAWPNGGAAPRLAFGG